jgi:hypothetical protein
MSNSEATAQSRSAPVESQSALGLGLASLGALAIGAVAIGLLTCRIRPALGHFRITHKRSSPYGDLAEDCIVQAESFC